MCRRNRREYNESTKERTKRGQREPKESTTKVTKRDTREHHESPKERPKRAPREHQESPKRAPRERQREPQESHKRAPRKPQREHQETSRKFIKMICKNIENVNVRNSEKQKYRYATLFALIPNFTSRKAPEPRDKIKHFFDKGLAAEALVHK